MIIYIILLHKCLVYNGMIFMGTFLPSWGTVIVSQLVTQFDSLLIYEKVSQLVRLFWMR